MFKRLPEKVLNVITTHQQKLLEWIASSYKDLMALPPDVRRRFGYALSLAQMASVVPACWRWSKTMPVARIERSTQ